MVPGVSTNTLSLPEAQLSAPEHDLLRAAREGDHRRAQALLEAGVRVDVHDRDGRRPLTLAAERGHVEAMRVLVQAGAPLDMRDAGKTPWTALMHALHADRAGAALALLEWGADPDVSEDSGYSALMMAASRGDPWVVDELLTRGADAGAQLFLGFTALDYAIGYGHLDVVRILLDAAPEVLARHNPARRAVLALAEKAGDAKILELLASYESGQIADSA